LFPDQIFIIAGGYFSHEGAVLARVVLARRFSRPALVRETSRASGFLALFYMIYYAVASTAALLFRNRAKKKQMDTEKNLQNYLQLGVPIMDNASSVFGLSKLDSSASGSDLLDGIIFADGLHKTMENLSLNLRRAHLRDAPLRHVLLYGPPGTGKTMVARRLAKLSGLDYAIMSGGDLGPLGQV
jgi:hypothetical protein